MEQPFQYFDQQVAGHDRLSANELMVIKPCQKREIEFYQTAQTYPDFSDFLPQCYGTLRAATQNDLALLESELDNVLVNADQEENLCLENVLHGFSRPCIMDLKLGSLLHHAQATVEKKERMIEQSKRTTSHELGLRICGMKVYDTTQCQYLAYDKQYGKSLTSQTIREAFMAYFFPHTGKNYTQSIPSQDNNITEKMPTKYMQWIIECLLDTLEEMKEAVVSLPQLSLISSSLLFVYEGDREAAEITWKKMIQQDAKKSTTIEEEEEMPKITKRSTRSGPGQGI
ncbi:hypothetical protein G6F56_011279 [Rhizopus delemar]|nr:hypothetical protein G6F56_011279 [Rhizopus delemar]